ncbi:MAG: SAVED domain-containing protein [Sphingobium sp.]|nr:SAVED domain-containing protein [Sphingobium sp.]
MLNYIIRSATDWLFRRRSPGYGLVRSGVALLLALLGGLSYGLNPTARGPLTFSWSTADGTAEAISWTVAFVAIALIVAGLLHIRAEWRRQERAKVIVIEARGLRDWSGDPLAEAVPSTIVGRPDPLILNFRQGLVDGQIVDPAVPLQKLSSLPDDLARRTEGLDRKDIRFVVGGLAPVPLLFLLGIIVDDEGSTTLMDWDRHARLWRTLDQDDDGKRFEVTGLDLVPAGTRRVALCVSASYDVLDSDVATVAPETSVVRLDLADRGTDAHWSEQKQQALGQQFLDVVIGLAARGVKEIALFVAAPASLAIRLGSLYDKRNLPFLEVNQYERGDPRTFPWAIRMPVGGLSRAELILR